MTRQWTVRVRRDFDRPVRESAEQLDGQTFTFRFGWEMGETDPYPGEQAWMPIDPLYPADAPVWIASGDLIEPVAVTP